MERNNDTKPLWRKTQGGNLTLANRKARIKYKEEIRLSEEDLGKYRSQFLLLEDGTGIYKVTATLAPLETSFLTG